MTGSRDGRILGNTVAGGADPGSLKRYSATKPFCSTESSVCISTSSEDPLETIIGGSCINFIYFRCNKIHLFTTKSPEPIHIDIHIAVVYFDEIVFARIFGFEKELRKSNVYAH
jgi:hypothetical protein